MDFDFCPFRLAVVAIASWALLPNEVKSLLQRLGGLCSTARFGDELKLVVHNAPAMNVLEHVVEDGHALLEAVAIIQQHKFAMA